MKMLENPRKLKKSPNLLVLFVKISKFLEFSKKITMKNDSFFELWWKPASQGSHRSLRHRRLHQRKCGQPRHHPLPIPERMSRQNCRLRKKGEGGQRDGVIPVRRIRHKMRKKKISKITGILKIFDTKSCSLGMIFLIRCFFYKKI